MKTPKRILVAHADAHTRRVLTMLLVESGLSVQAVEPEAAAVTNLQSEPFDLALIGHLTPSDDLFALTVPLRKLQPELPIVMLVPELELPVVVQGIRHGLTDVLPLRTDPKPVLRRIMTLVGYESYGEPTPAELAEVEATLAQLDPAVAAEPLDMETAGHRERLWKALRELHLEREIIAAAQAGMDEKARLLGADRRRLREERVIFAAELAELKSEGEDLDRLWAELDDQRKSLEQDRESLAQCERELRSREQAVNEAQTTPPIPPRVPGTQRELEAEWDELERAKSMFAAERAIFRDERMLLADMDRQIHEKEERVKALGDQIKDLDRQRRGLPPPPPKGFPKPKITAVRKPGLFRSLLGGGA
jgi:DNA-binding response OmpR family regulator